MGHARNEYIEEATACWGICGGGISALADKGGSGYLAIAENDGFPVGQKISH
jgi:hypothetical protein